MLKDFVWDNRFRDGGNSVKNEKILLDNSGTVLKVGDQIMYVTSYSGDIRINYGVIRSITRKKRRHGCDNWSVKVWKECGKWLEEPKQVVLTGPTLFKCGVELPYPTDTVVAD